MTWPLAFAIVGTVFCVCAMIVLVAYFAGKDVGSGRNYEDVHKGIFCGFCETEGTAEKKVAWCNTHNIFECETCWRTVHRPSKGEQWGDDGD